MKLRADWMAQASQARRSGQFHDAFLAHGAAPMPRDPARDARRRLADPRLALQLAEQLRQIVGVLLFLREDLLHHPARRRCRRCRASGRSRCRSRPRCARRPDPRGSCPRASRASLYSAWLRVAQAAGLRFGIAAELGDPLRDHVGVLLLLVRVLEELLLRRPRRGCPSPCSSGSCSAACTRSRSRAPR